MFNLKMKPTMRKYVPLVLLLHFLIPAHKVFAGEGLQCPQAKVQASNGQTLILKEYEFEHGVHDLVVSNIDKPEIKRVTYSGKAILNTSGEQSCRYKAVAIAQGGDWGWHLAWMLNDKSGAYYSRMDGEAWVSTPAKRISEENADALQLTVKNEQVTLTGYASKNSPAAMFSVTSEDEGRNW